jgi:hypothetical protein
LIDLHCHDRFALPSLAWGDDGSKNLAMSLELACADGITTIMYAILAPQFNFDSECLNRGLPTGRSDFPRGL